MQILTNCSTDSEAELEAIRVAALEAGADAAVSAWHWGEGGKGAIELAKAVVDTCSLGKQNFRYLYDLDTSIEEKIGIISREIYGAEGIDLSEEAKKKVTLYEKQVFHLQGLLSFAGLRKTPSLYRKDAVFVLNRSECQRGAHQFQNSYSGSQNISRSRIHCCVDW